uniref:NACHT domain-containing protein n=1 Tax=Hucho hucho TaxID=62062 RepID=A0A4W5PVP1_9TELE
MPYENTTQRVGHSSRASPKAREEQFPDTKEKNGQLFCNTCNCVLDHTKKQSIDKHLTSVRHLAKKKAKDEGKELANDIQPEYPNTFWSEDVLRCKTCKRALDHTWKPSVSRHLTACKRKAEHDDDWKPPNKNTSSHLQGHEKHPVLDTDEDAEPMETTQESSNPHPVLDTDEDAEPMETTQESSNPTTSHHCLETVRGSGDHVQEALGENRAAPLSDPTPPSLLNPTLPPPKPSFLQPSTQLPSTSSQSICPFPKASRSSVTERPTRSLDLSETEKRREVDYDGKAIAEGRRDEHGNVNSEATSFDKRPLHSLDSIETEKRCDKTDAKFVDGNRAELIQRVTSVMYIADKLLQGGMIHDEIHSNISAAKTRQEQMRELYKTFNSIKVKSAFYRILQKKETYLVQELECLPQAQQTSLTYQGHAADDVSIAIKKHKAVLREKYKLVSEGIGKERDPEVFNNIYTELYITTGESERLNSEHEVSHLEDTSQLKADKINCNDIFKPLLGIEKGKERPIRTVLTKGIAGIGKTFSVQKFILDWAEGKANKDIDFIFVLPFRELNLIGRPYSVHSLLSSFHPGLKELDAPLYERPTYTVMIIFDGLDESRFPLDFENNETLFKITDKQSVSVLLTNIIKRNLFPEALLWITSRPAAANQIPSEYIDQVTVVRGFNDKQKEEYFKKNVKDEKLARRIISHVTMSRSLHIMCQIPIFCWIAAMILGKMLSKKVSGVPKTLTAMYTHFLVTLTDFKDQTNHTNPQNVLKQNRSLILKLGLLAFNHLGEAQMFYEKDLSECGITDEEREGSLFSAMFTEIIKREDVIYRKPVYYFVHLTIQEFFASLFVFHCFISNEMNDLKSFINVKFRGRPKVHTFLERVVNKASKSENGHLDLLVRFLHGFLLESNQQLLEGLLTLSMNAEEISESVEEIRKYLKYMPTQDISPERCINLFHCLIEMGDKSLNKDIQAYLSHKDKKSSVKLTADHCSSLAFVLLKSGEELDVFDLKKYKASWEKRRRLVPAVRCCRKALLADCRLTNEACEIVADALRSANSPLRELDLSQNDLQDSGVKLLSAGLGDPHCELEILRLSFCRVTEVGSAFLASALKSNPSHLRELDLSFNHPGDSGLQLLSARLKDARCKLQKLKLVQYANQFFGGLYSILFEPQTVCLF